MISAKQCRIYAAECKVLASSSDISTQRSLEQSIMSLNWSALADEIYIDSTRHQRHFRPPRVGGPFHGSSAKPGPSNLNSQPARVPRPRRIIAPRWHPSEIHPQPPAQWWLRLLFEKEDIDHESR
jgi:hypothetical protein